MDPIIGIDLGTTFSAVAVLRDGGPVLIPNALGEPLTPSVVGIDEDGKILVGAAAKELRVTKPERCAWLFKRKIGTDWTTELDGRKFTPEELSSCVLSSLKGDAEVFLGGTVRKAVITVPAYFNDQQRKATIAAGQIAGLEVERIVNEPTAAALAYGFHEAKDEKSLLIFDLGGGTFDVSVVDLFEGTIEVRASAGESILGGEDFTRTMAARLLDRQGRQYERAEHESPLQVARLLQQCEVAKRQLSRQDSVIVRMPSKDGTFAANCEQMPVSRAEFDTWTERLLSRVELPIRRVLGDAKLNRESINEVILVGGATRMPQVVKRVTEIMGKPPHCRLNPDEVVALGAAVQAGLFARNEAVEDLVVTDISPFTLGIEIVKKFGPEHRNGYFLPMIERNTTIPVSRVHRVSTLHANQTSMNLAIYQGEGRHVSENLLLGSFEVTGIPRGPAGQEVDVRFTYDLNGVLEVEATVVATQKMATHVVTRHARGMTSKQVEAAVRAMSKLKTHPREEQANRFLLRRAERLFAELSPEQRDQLGELLDGFETVLGLQDAKAIARYREALKEFLDLHDSGESDSDEPDAA